MSVLGWVIRNTWFCRHFTSTFELTKISENVAPSEARTHGLQIMRLRYGDDNYLTKTVLPTGGLEPPIFGLGDRRLIHWATRAVSAVLRRYLLRWRGGESGQPGSRIATFVNSPASPVEHETCIMKAFILTWSCSKVIPSSVHLVFKSDITHPSQITAFSLVAFICLCACLTI